MDNSVISKAENLKERIELLSESAKIPTPSVISALRTSIKEAVDLINIGGLEVSTILSKSIENADLIQQSVPPIMIIRDRKNEYKPYEDSLDFLLGLGIINENDKTKLVEGKKIRDEYATKELQGTANSAPDPNLKSNLTKLCNEINVLKNALSKIAQKLEDPKLDKNAQKTLKIEQAEKNSELEIAELKYKEKETENNHS